jgi:hypothetical protein
LTTTHRIEDDAYKGAALTSFLEWYAALAGPVKLDAALDTIPEDYRRQLDRTQRSMGILPATWYPALLVHALLDAIVKQVGATDIDDFAERAGRAVTEKLIGGLYAGLFRSMASPDLYAKYAPKLWRSYYRMGRVEAEVVDSGETRVRMSEWPGHHPLVCDINRAAAGLIFQKMGCAKVESVRTRCVHGGQRYCEVVLTYMAGLRL